MSILYIRGLGHDTFMGSHDEYFVYWGFKWGFP